jgi:hypothetical protein
MLIQRTASFYARGLVVLLVAVMAMASMPGAAVAGSRDRQRPSVTLATADNAVLVGPTGLTGHRITGTMRDNRGIQAVWIEFCGGATPCGMFLSQAGDTGEMGIGTLCRGGKTCNWGFDIPFDMVGRYELRAVAVDAAGNRRATKPVQVTVLAPCPPCWLP